MHNLKLCFTVPVLTSFADFGNEPEGAARGHERAWAGVPLEGPSRALWPSALGCWHHAGWELHTKLQEVDRCCADRSSDCFEGRYTRERCCGGSGTLLFEKALEEPRLKASGDDFERLLLEASFMASDAIPQLGAGSMVMLGDELLVKFCRRLRKLGLQALRAILQTADLFLQDQLDELSTSNFDLGWQFMNADHNEIRLVGDGGQCQQLMKAALSANRSLAPAADCLNEDVPKAYVYKADDSLDAVPFSFCSSGLAERSWHELQLAFIQVMRDCSEREHPSPRGMHVFEVKHVVSLVKALTHLVRRTLELWGVLFTLHSQLELRRNTSSAREMQRPRLVFEFSFACCSRASAIEAALLSLSANIGEPFLVPYRILEIGVFHGSLGMRLLSSFKNLDYTGVDPFHVYAETAMTVEEREQQFQRTSSTLQAYGGRLLRMTSAEAAAALEAESCFDLAFIDGEHTYQAALQDLELWAPRLCPGGVLGGHDFDLQFYGVMQAVIDFQLSGAFATERRVVLGADSTFFICQKNRTWRPRLSSRAEEF